MLLQRLNEYADRLDLPPAMYQETPIRWVIELDRDTERARFVQQQGKGRRVDRGMVMLCPHVQRSSGVKPKLLADNAEYVLGVQREASKASRVEEQQKQFKLLIEECVATTGEEAVRSVARFLDHWDGSGLPTDIDGGDNVTFKVGDIFPIELLAVQRFWADRIQGSIHQHTMTCLVCGNYKPISERLPVPIKGIPGGQTSGMALISANSTAFESYGLKASLIAPTCRDCGERVANALNALIRDEISSLFLGDMLYLFWTRESPVGFSVLVKNPDPEQVKELLRSVWTGRERDDVREEPFYAVALSASGGRVVVRDWIETTLSAARQNLARWFQLQEIVDFGGEPAHPVGLYSLAHSLVRDPGKEHPSPQAPKALLRTAILGGELPQWLLYQAVRRNRAEQGVSRNRAMLIKMVLASKGGSSLTKELYAANSENTHPAYVCGRLLAVLGSIQYRATGARATIIDRYYGAASSAPGTVFGTLLRGTQAHLGKLRRTNERSYHYFEQKIGEIMRPLADFPARFSLEEQALFALGYYHERATRGSKRGESTDSDNETEGSEE